MDPIVLIGVGVGVAAVAGLGFFLARGRKISVDDIPPDDGKTCAACGNTDLTHPADGVYVCRCGFEGGPGMLAYTWKLRCDRIAAMQEDEREQLRSSSEKDARTMLEAARGDYEAAARAFAQGDAIIPMGGRGANQKTELFNAVRGHLPSAEEYIREAIASVETARHIASGGAQMTEWYDRLRGSRESALTVTGIQASSALRQQLHEVGTVLSELERELAG